MINKLKELITELEPKTKSLIFDDGIIGYENGIAYCIERLEELIEAEEEAKTLEELGWKFILHEEWENKQMVLYEKEGRITTIKLHLRDDGNVDLWSFDNMYLTQELCKAIELEMKKRGWWK